MAQTFVTDSGTLVIPSAVSKITVQTNNSGIATSGTLMFVGEAEQGPGYASEVKLEDNAFGPDQLSDVIAKYGSGPIVDAFRASCVASADVNITGSFSKGIIVKTNASVAASASLLKYDSTSYGTLLAKLEGKKGNLITYKVTADTAEVIPTTGSFTFIPNVGTVNAELRISGAAALTLSLSANTSPTAFKTAVDGLAGITATGGADRAILPGIAAGTLAVDANPGGAGVRYVTVTRSVAYAASAVVGDTMVIPLGSAIAGGSDVNVGAYVITAVTSTVITAYKLSDAGKGGAVPGTVTNPVDVGATAMVATSDVEAFSPVVITLDAADPIAGVGKSLEIAALSTGTDLLTRTAYQLNITPVTWISVSGTAALLSSSAEYKADLNIARSLDNIDEDIVAGGDIALKISYLGTTGVLTINKTTNTFSTTVVGGSGASIPSTLLADYPTIGDFVTYVNSQTGYSASTGTAALGQLPMSALDAGSFNIGSTWGAKNGRVKADAYKFFLRLADSSLVEMSAAAQAGIPAPKAIAYLAGGVKGSSTAANVLAAVDALEGVRGNFVIPLFSRDASSDIIDGLTDSGSTYTIDAINLAVKSHVLKMSTLKKRRNRQAFLSKNDTFVNQKEAAGNIASARASLSFQDFKQLGGDGNIQQFQSWMGAALAAGMQAAGFYRAIFFKNINTVGTIHAAGDYDEQNDSEVEDALLSGLLPAKKSESGGYIWVSDQTTYSKDSNFVYNSIQAMYVADVIALTTAQRMEAAFVGQTLGDISAAIALSFLEGIMADFLRLKLIAPSDDAPKGFKNAKIRINGPAMIVEVEIKLAGALYFIPINFLVSQVTQTAG